MNQQEAISLEAAYMELEAIYAIAVAGGKIEKLQAQIQLPRVQNMLAYLRAARRIAGKEEEAI